MTAHRGARSIACMAPFHLALVDDDCLQRQRLTRLLAAAGMPCEYAASSGAELLAWAGAHALDLLLVDLGLPDGSGTDVIRALHRIRPHCQCLVLTLFADEAHLLPALAAGASGYLLKDVDEDELARHIAHLREGGSPLSPLMARSLLRHWQRTQPDPDAEALTRALTPREQEVLACVARGFRYSEIATQLGVSATTVQTHVRSVYAKLGVHTKTEAVFEARQAGLLH